MGQEAMQVRPVHFPHESHCQGIRFEPKDPTQLVIQMAKSNSKTKRMLDNRMFCATPVD